MINLGGDILKWVFGTASNTDLVNLHSRLQTFAQANEAIVFSIQDQATTVSENLRRTELNTKILEELHDTLEHLDMHFIRRSSDEHDAKHCFPSRPTPYGRNPISSRNI